MAAAFCARDAVAQVVAKAGFYQSIASVGDNKTLFWSGRPSSSLIKVDPFCWEVTQEAETC